MIIVSITLAFHVILLIYISFPRAKLENRKDNTVFKMVDVKEYIPYVPKEDVEKVEINKQEDIVEDVIETDKEVKELEIDYLPQHKISEMPGLPLDLIKSKKVYPPLANKQGIEGVVYLELCIDQKGIIRNIQILKDPGFGLGEAAVKAFQGITCIPAKSNGIPVAARIRYPVRFSLKK